MNDLEIRSYAGQASPLCSNGRTVEGYAIVFNQSSRIMYDAQRRLYFEEVIDRAAISEDFLQRQDIILNRDHNNTLILGRYRFGGGSCELTIDEYGVKYRSELPETALGDETLEAVKRGDLFGSSFAFRYAKDGYKDERTQDGTYLRRVTEFAGIYDVSIVANPAYFGTSVGARAFDALDVPAVDEQAAVAQAEAERAAAAVRLRNQQMLQRAQAAEELRQENNRRRLQGDFHLAEISTT